MGYPHSTFCCPDGVFTAMPCAQRETRAGRRPLKTASQFLIFSFFLIKKKQKIKAGKITALSCHAAMFRFCATVTSTFDRYC